MAQTINTNISSLTAQRNTTRTQNELSTAINRLSSGLRINSAKDDAAGLAISERFTTQIRGLNQAARNANDGISLAQVAEGALGSISNNLQRMRELAVQAANATNSASDRAALQAEVAQLQTEITRVASSTEFNGIKLLDGSFTGQTFQVGANAAQTITVSNLGDSRTTALGLNSLSLAGSVTGSVVVGATVNGVTSSANGLSLTTSAGTASAISWPANSGAKEIAEAINNSAASIGITATATNSTELNNLTGITPPQALSFDLNGETVSVNITNGSDLTELVSNINGLTNLTGVTATFTNPASKSGITLTTNDGRNIVLENFSAGAGTMDFGGTTLNATDDAVKTGTVELISTKGQIEYADADTTVFAAASGTSNFDELTLVDISAGNGQGARDALAVIDAALTQISSARADLGAIQNRFTSTIENLTTSSENQAAARGRILDADFAQETANLARAQVLQQAGTAMIAQANQLPQAVLQLLRS